MKNKFVGFFLGWLGALAILLSAAFIFVTTRQMNALVNTLLLCGGVLVIQLVVSFFGCQAARARKKFHGASLRGVSVIMLALVVFVLLMQMIFELPLVFSLIVCLLVLTVQALLVAFSVEIKPDAVEVAQATDAQIKEKTECIRMLTVEAQNLMARPMLAEEGKTLVRKVYEAIRYSDPMSCEELMPLEEQIKECFKKFSKAVCDTEKGEEDALCEELLALVAERNNKCKMLK